MTSLRPVHTVFVLVSFYVLRIPAHLSVLSKSVARHTKTKLRREPEQVLVTWPHSFIRRGVLYQPSEHTFK